MNKGMGLMLLGIADSIRGRGSLHCILHECFI